MRRQIESLLGKAVGVDEGDDDDDSTSSSSDSSSTYRRREGAKAQVTFKDRETDDDDDDSTSESSSSYSHSLSSSDDDDSSSSSSSSSSSTSTSTSVSNRRNNRDNRRLELLVEEALKAPQVESSSGKAVYRSRPYEIRFTTVLDEMPDTFERDPRFGPILVASYVNPPTGLLGPPSIRQAVRNQLSFFSNNFQELTTEVRKAAYYQELELRTLLEGDGEFDLRSKAFTTPCFPVTDEPELRLEFMLLVQNAAGAVWERVVVADTFFDADGEFVDDFILELNRKTLSDNGEIEVGSAPVVQALVRPCTQYSYFS